MSMKKTLKELLNGHTKNLPDNPNLQDDPANYVAKAINKTFDQLIDNIDRLKVMPLKIPELSAAPTSVQGLSDDGSLLRQAEIKRKLDATKEEHTRKHEQACRLVKDNHEQTVKAFESFAETLLKRRQPLSEEDALDLDLLNTTLMFDIKLRGVNTAKDLEGCVQEFLATKDKINNRLANLTSNAKTREEWGGILACLGGCILIMSGLFGVVLGIPIGIILPETAPFIGGLFGSIFLVGMSTLGSGISLMLENKRIKHIQHLEKSIGETHKLFSSVPAATAPSVATNDNDNDNVSGVTPVNKSSDTLGDAAMVKKT